MKTKTVNGRKKRPSPPPPRIARFLTPLEPPRHKWTGVLIGSPAVAFAFEIIASQFGAVSGRPSVGRASCSNGTSPVTRETSPTADVDRSYHIPMSHPSTLSTNIRPVLRFIPGRTSRTFLGGIGRVYLPFLSTKSLGLVADEGGQLVVAPTILHTVVFAGFRPTTCTCRALADTLQGFDFDRSYPLFMGMVDDLPGNLMVDILHRARLFYLHLLHGTSLLV